MASPELLRTLNARTAPGWRPAEGDILTGRIVSITRAESEYGAYPRLVIENEYGMVAVHAFHSTLKQGLADLHAAGHLADGALITIAYAGRRITNATKNLPAEKQIRYELYTVLAGDGTAADETPVTGDLTDLLG